MEHKFFIELFTDHLLEVSKHEFTNQLRTCRLYPHAYPHEIVYSFIPGLPGLFIKSRKLHILYSRK